MKNKIALLFLAVVFSSFSVFAESVLHFGTSGEPGTLDPHKASGTWENHILGNLFLGLMTEDAASKTIYGNAEKHTVSQDGKTYTFTLRKNSWSDGVPVTAHDFEYGFKRILNPDFNAEYATLLYTIKNGEQVKTGKMPIDELGVKALDDYTLKIELQNPAPYFLAQLKHYTAFPVPKHLVEKLGDDWVKPGNMVNNGAFVLTEWVPNTYITAVKNSKFYDAANVKIDKIFFYPTEDRSAALKKFRAGELHYNGDVPVDQIKWIQENLKDEFFMGPNMGIYYYSLNVKNPKLADKNIRKALAMAINRDIITEKVTLSFETPAYGFVPPIPGFNTQSADFKKNSMKQRLAEAKSIMKKAGYSDTKPMTLQLRYNTSENHKKIAVAISAMWKSIYVKTELLNSDVAVHYDELENHNFEVGRAGWVADYPDPQNFLFILMSGDGNNYSDFSNKEFDSLMKLSETQQGNQRAQTLAKAHEIIINELPIIPIYYYVYKNLVSKKLVGFVPNEEDTHRARYLSLK